MNNKTSDIDKMLREVMTQRAEMISNDNLHLETMKREVMAEIKVDSRNVVHWKRYALYASACLAAIFMGWHFISVSSTSESTEASHVAQDVSHHGIFQIRMPHPDKGHTEKPTIPDNGGQTKPQNPSHVKPASRPTYDELLAASIEMSETDTFPRVPDELRGRNPIEANVAMTEAIYRNLMTIENHKPINE